MNYIRKMGCFLAVLLIFTNCQDNPIEEEKPESPPVVDVGAVDPNFHVFLCFGQSNMEGGAQIENIDRESINDRFQVMTVAPDDEEKRERTVGEWYKATPPLCRWNTGLTPVDYFGRTLVAELSKEVKVGVIMVAMGGAGIDAFDKDNYSNYYENTDAWQKGLMNIYGGNPYAKMVEMCKKAQESGVIKGILLHQGETNNMQQDWPDKVKKIYESLLSDLTLGADTVPLLAGEMLYEDRGGLCWGMNGVIAKLPDVIDNAYIVSAMGCTGKDEFHFDAQGYRELGKRYANKYLSLQEKQQEWPMKKLHIEGRYLKDETGKIVNLHGFAQTYSPFFNNNFWNNYDVRACLNYNQGLIDKMLSAGWEFDFCRLHMDPYWSTTTGCSGRYEGHECFNEGRFRKYLDEVFIPMAEYMISKGLYVVMRPPGVCPHNIVVGDDYNDYLIQVWGIVSRHPKINSNPHIMFELANEPIDILGPDGTYAGNGQGHFDNMKIFCQSIVDEIRKYTDNIIWVPGLGYQSSFSGFTHNPVIGDNIGYAVHLYPGWMNSDGENEDGGSSTGGYEPFQQGWDSQVKPVADFAPIIITEMDWAPAKYNASWGKAHTGTVGGPGFGANFKYITDNSGNVSWLIFTDCARLAEFRNIPGTPGAYTFLNDPEACPWPVYHWLKDYAQGWVTKSAVKKLSVEGLQANKLNILTGSNRYIIIKATYDDGVTEIVTSKTTLTSSNTSAVKIGGNGKLTAVKNGEATITAAYKGPLGDTKELSLMVKASTFPLATGVFNPSIWEDGTFDEATNTLVTGQWGFGGWIYNNGIDISDYKKIVVELGNDNKAGVSFRLFDENSYWTGAAQYDFGNSRKIVVDIHNMKKADGSRKLDPTHIYIAGFWTTGGVPIIIKDIYLTED